MFFYWSLEPPGTTQFSINQLCASDSLYSHPFPAHPALKTGRKRCRNRRTRVRSVLSILCVSRLSSVCILVFAIKYIAHILAIHGLVSKYIKQRSSAFLEHLQPINRKTGKNPIICTRIFYPYSLDWAPGRWRIRIMGQILKMDNNAFKSDRSLTWTSIKTRLSVKISSALFFP